MKINIVLLMTLLVSGCVSLQPRPQVVEVTVANPVSSPVAYALPSPPIPDGTDFKLGTDDGLRTYTTAVNWYLYRVYNYTYILNKEAISRGWVPPRIEPLCLTQPWPVLADSPDIVISPTSRKSQKGVEWSLTEYIKRSRALYDDQRNDFIQFELWQRKMCNF